MAEYESVQRTALKLKGVSDHGIKKKKKKKSKDKDKKKLEQITSNSQESEESLVTQSTSWRDRRTKAEMAFERANSQKSAEDIIKKASKTHKERIMEFNHHLDSLSEHFDIPKVSWTK